MFQRILRRRALWVLVGALSISVLISGGSVRRYWMRRQELNHLEDRLVAMRQRVRGLEARRARADKDEAYIETAARRELGLVKPDEIEFRFVNTVSTTSVVTSKD